MAKELKEHLDELEKKYTQGNFYSFNHIIELYLFQYYCKESVSGLAEEPMNRWYLELGNSYEKSGDLELALEAYEKASQWNPVDLDARLAKIEVEKKRGELESVWKDTLELYPFLCSRATMARFYRNLGFYFVEMYKPEMAAILYDYSNLFFATVNADNELDYVEEALQKEFPKYEVSQLQEKISEIKIPVGAPSETLGIIYEVGKSEERKGHKKEAAECYMMLYDLTQDEEIKEKLNNLLG